MVRFKKFTKEIRRKSSLDRNLYKSYNQSIQIKPTFFYNNIVVESILSLFHFKPRRLSGGGLWNHSTLRTHVSMKSKPCMTDFSQNILCLWFIIFQVESWRGPFLVDSSAWQIRPRPFQTFDRKGQGYLFFRVFLKIYLHSFFSLLCNKSFMISIRTRKRRKTDEKNGKASR